MSPRATQHRGRTIRSGGITAPHHPRSCHGAFADDVPDRGVFQLLSPLSTTSGFTLRSPLPKLFACRSATTPTLLMKFGHSFQEHLQQDGFPAHWVASAISYRQLKKCIKRVEKELASLGLDAATLGLLLQTAEQERDEKLAEYLLSNPQSTLQDSDAPVLFQPKLLIAVDEATGEPLDAHLSPKTREYLHQLAITQQLSDVRVSEIDTSPSTTEQNSSESTRRNSSEDITSPRGIRRSAPTHRMVELPLTSDFEFFSILQNELSGLAALQAQEQKKLSKEVKSLGTAVTRATEPTRGSASKTDMAKWRKIFELYLESNVFFSTNELDHGKHDSAKAQVALQKFADELQRQHIVSKFKKKESSTALDQFMQLNMDLLQSLRFQEINDLATQKILKSKQASAAFVAPYHVPLTINHLRRVRQAHRPRRQNHLPRRPAAHPPPRHGQGNLPPALHRAPATRPAAGRLPLPRLLQHLLPAHPPALPAHLLHPLPRRPAARAPGPLPALPRPRRHGGRQPEPRPRAGEVPRAVFPRRGQGEAEGE